MPHTNGGRPETDGPDATLSDQTGEFTGRYLVVFNDEMQGDAKAINQTLRSSAGLTNLASTLDFEEGAVDPDQTESADGTVFAALGIAVVSAEPSQAGALTALEEDPRILAVEPERIQYAIQDVMVSVDYIRGYRDGVLNLYEQLPV